MVVIMISSLFCISALCCAVGLSSISYDRKPNALNYTESGQDGILFSNTETFDNVDDSNCTFFTTGSEIVSGTSIPFSNSINNDVDVFNDGYAYGQYWSEGGLLTTRDLDMTYSDEGGHDWWIRGIENFNSDGTYKAVSYKCFYNILGIFNESQVSYPNNRIAWLKVDITYPTSRLSSNYLVADVYNGMPLYQRQTRVLNQYHYHVDYSYNELTDNVSFVNNGNGTSTLTFDLPLFLITAYGLVNLQSTYSYNYSYSPSFNVRLANNTSSIVPDSISWRILFQDDDIYTSGYDDGYGDGYNNGYATGYNVGVNSQPSNQSWLGLFGAIADTPIVMLTGLFDFDLFGMNLLSVVLSLLTSMVVLYVIRKVI